MSKLMSILFAAAFATLSAGSFAASHGGAMKDDKAAAEMKACKEKCKKDDAACMKKCGPAEAKKDDKKMDDKKK